MIVTFWILLLLIIYCYFGYPLLIGLAAKCSRYQTQRRTNEPSVSIVLSIWNEEEVIKKKIENLCSLDYPQEKMEILIGSDGSTDRTEDIIKQFSDPRIQVFDSSVRRGKMFTINHLVEQAKNEIIVFTDARQIFERDAIKRLVSNFSDPNIGCVSGELIFSKREGGTAQGINLYWNYEKWIRRNESDMHSMLGATGAIYAIRRKLFTNIPAGIVLDDMFVPIKIIQKGFRAIFDPLAKATDEVSDSPIEEHRRKARTLFGNYQIFWIFRTMFNPLKSPIALQLFSHKLLRVLIPFFMIALFFINWSLFNDPFFAALFYLQIAFYTMAVIGGLARHQKYGILKIVSKVCYVPYVFCLLNFSALAGFFRLIFGRQDILWAKARDERNDQ